MNVRYCITFRNVVKIPGFVLFYRKDMLINVKSANIYLFVDISHNDCLSNKFNKYNAKLY